MLINPEWIRLKLADRKDDLTAGKDRRHHARDKTVNELADNGYDARRLAFWFDSRSAHQRESANMIHAMKKRGISDKGRAVATG